MVYRESISVSSSGMSTWSRLLQWQFTPSTYSTNGRYIYEWETIMNEIDRRIKLLSDANFRLYSAKFTHNWNLYFEFVPCYRKSDNEVWLYDLVNDVFYSNSSWEWAFIAWPNV